VAVALGDLGRLDVEEVLPRSGDEGTEVYDRGQPRLGAFGE
jgi:hypothetical protein